MRHNGVALWVALLFASWAWADQEDRWVPFKQLSPNTPPGMVLATAPSEGQILMTLTESVTNWDSAAQLPGFQGWDYPVSNPCQPPNPSNWTGVSCEGGNVIRMCVPSHCAPLAGNCFECCTSPGSPLFLPAEN